MGCSIQKAQRLEAASGFIHAQNQLGYILLKVPCTGVSIGIERLFSILEARARSGGGKTVRTTETEVLVASGQKGFLEARMKTCAMLWNEGIKVPCDVMLNDSDHM